MSQHAGASGANFMFGTIAARRTPMPLPLRVQFHRHSRPFAAGSLVLAAIACWSLLADARGTSTTPRPDPPAVARIAGHVTDQQRRPLRGAQIALHSTESVEILSTQTDGDGAFVFLRVAPGHYQVAVFYRGTGGMSDEALLFEAGETYTLDLPMDIPAEDRSGR
jgi:hypothetical protein